MAGLTHIEYILLALKEYYYVTRAADIRLYSPATDPGTVVPPAGEPTGGGGSVGDSEYYHNNIYYTWEYTYKLETMSIITIYKTLS